MSIGGINSSSNWWNYQSQATQAAQNSTDATATTADSTGSINNSGTTTAANLSSFMQAFSADLQAMLTQMGSSTADGTATASAATSSSGSTATTASTSDPTITTQTASTDQQNGVHHHHHHHEDGSSGQGDSLDGAANQLIGSIGQSLQNGTASARGISNSASLLATDLTQAMQAYGSTSSNASALATLA